MVGTTVTSGAANTYGTWTQLSTGLRDTGYYVIFSINNVIVSGGNTRNAYLDIGIGPNSGAVTTLIPYLCGSHNGGYNNSNSATGGSVYSFPLVIPRNTPIWCRHQNTAATTGAEVTLTVLSGTSFPAMMPRVTEYNVIGTPGTATTTGIAITPGTSGEGAWTQMVASAPLSYSGFLISGLFTTDQSMSNTGYTVDIGVGAAAAEIAIAENTSMTFHGSNETANRYSIGVFTPVNAGERISARVACNTSPDASMSVLLLGMVS